MQSLVPEDAGPRSVRERYRKRVVIGLVLLILYSLAGFFLVPRVVERQIVSTFDETFGIIASLEQVKANPFTFSLTLRGLKAQSHNGEELFGLEEFFVNFQSSSLFRWAWTFGEVRITRPWFHAVIDSEGRLNLAEALTPKGPAANDLPPAGAEEEVALPRLLIHRLVLEAGRGEFRDLSRPTPFQTELGPLSLDLAGFNTLPDRDGSLKLSVVLESDAKLTWEGTIDVDPVRSEGRIELIGGHSPMAWRYLQDQLGFRIDRGSSDLTLTYSAIHENNETTLEVRNGLFHIRDLVLSTLDEEIEVLRLPAITLEGMEFDWPSRRVSVADVSLTGARLQAWRDSDGTINLMEMADPSAVDEAPAGQEEVNEVAESGDRTMSLLPDWDLSLGRLVVSDFSAEVEDRSFMEPFRTGIESFQLEITGLDNQPDSRFDFSTSLEVTTGGSASVEGKVGLLPSPFLDGSVTLQGLEFLPAQALLAGLLDLDIKGGSLTLKGQATSDDNEMLRYLGSVEVAGLACHDRTNNELFFGLQRLWGEETLLEVSSPRLRVASVDLEGLYGNLLIRQDFTTNVGDVLGIDLLGAEGENPAPDEEAASTGPAPPGTPLPEFVVEIGAVNIIKSAADFADLSLPLPFSARIEDLGGTVTELASGGTSARIKAEGRVDEHGLALIEGSMDMFAPDRNADMGVAFRNVEMRNLTPYFSKFAGYEIDKGRLSLDLRYVLKDRHLESQNNILLDQLTLGEKVDSPDAIGLPIRLAVAMLKDKDGRIELDVPVSGTLDDPQFDYARVAWQAVRTILKRVATAPFRALARLVGAGDKDLEFVEFAAGKSDLGPPAREQLDILLKALRERPQLVLEVRGVYDEPIDGEQIRKARLDALVEARMAAQPDPAGGEPALASERQRAAYESIFLENFPRETLDALLVVHSGTPESFEASDGSASEPIEPVLDLTGYLDALRDDLLEVQQVPEEDLLALADARGETIASFIIAGGGEPETGGLSPDRIHLEPGGTVKDGGDRWVRVKLVVSAE